ncbi:MAG: DUF1788 domain-containing protein [Verrucomicrobiae bacterium]|nr:DUF1788 domain-containing protein [Verrucomicrobiae bacterium]NNJ42135.1 DUF1788 domain-containing protein [Akkermansiaceae bacterium]
MSSFPKRIDELIRQLGTSASAVDSKQGDRVYNFHYHPHEWTEFRQQLQVIQKRLKEQGFTPHVASFADITLNIFQSSPIYSAQVKMEGMGSFSHKMRNDSLYNILSGSSSDQRLTTDAPIVSALIDKLQETAKLDNGVLMLTDTETIHPLFRISAFEQILQGKFLVPTVICYPGERGNHGDNPSFLGFYNSDGNYRSQHIY